MQLTGQRQLEIPATLRHQLLAYRRRVWRLKLIEASAGAAIGVLVGFLAVYLLDRAFDTPQLLRALLFAAAMLGCMLVPLAIDRWVFRRRRLDQLARLLSETHPSIGHQLLGILELSGDVAEQSRSPALVRAAIDQVAREVAAQDLSHAIPLARHKTRLVTATTLAVIAIALLWLTTAAAKNTWARFLTPWQDTPRYTFAALEPIPEQHIVAHGEPFELEMSLRRTSQWKPATASALWDTGEEQTAEQSGGHYRFQMPGQITPRTLALRVGDFRGQTRIVPVLRPEITSLQAIVSLPPYLGREEPRQRELRGSVLSVVRGSTAQLKLTASRPLKSAQVDGKAVQPSEAHFSTDPMRVEQEREVRIQWRDHYDLSGQDALVLSLEPYPDEAPTLVCENLPRKKVLLDSEVISFDVRVRDDFGIKRVGMEWVAVDHEANEPGIDGYWMGGADGERLIGAGGPTQQFLELAATFCPRDEKITPQTIAFRVFAEDYLPGRERAYGPTCFFEVLDPSEHAVWVNSQLDRWHRMALDVRDRELQLHQTNRELREMPESELAKPETREKLAAQADREEANAQQLEGLVRSGEGLLQEAMRNEEIGAGHLDRWAEMMKTLKEISEERMPSVADLLKKASMAEASASPSETKPPAEAGQNRLEQTVEAEGDQPSQSDTSPSVPKVSDIESTQHEFDAAQLKKNSSNSPSSPARLGLTQTQLAGGAADAGEGDDSIKAPVDQAVNEQEGLLEEFQKVADDLNDVLGNLEGSTLVKRLKSASRTQTKVAEELASLATSTFGVSQRDKQADAEAFGQLAEIESGSSREVSNIMDDMSAYFTRTQLALFGRVLEQMREQDVTAGLRVLSEELQDQSGLSIAQAEFWSDSLDRWAEDLVEATQAGESPATKAKGSLPPAVVLEVLRVLESEVNLRQQTRVAEQSRPAVSDTEHMMTANELSQRQHGLSQRLGKVVEQMRQLPGAEADFAKEIGMLQQVGSVMNETVEILAKPETGPPAIAAETEIIELMLQSKRFNPNAGGGGGAQPGGGSDGDTETPALALMGSGSNPEEVLQPGSATQATGSTGGSPPEEFRSGLDRYFSELEAWQGQQP